MDLKPSEIYYSQDSISKCFRRKSSHGTQTIGQTLDQVIAGDCSITDIPRISILNLPGNHNKWFSDDNRRLWVFKQLERLGYLDTVRVKCTVYNYNRHNKKITTKNGGVSIKIRGDGQPGGAAHTLPDNCYDQKKGNIGKVQKENDDQQKMISGNREVQQGSFPSHINITSQPTVGSSCEDKEPLKSSAHQESAGFSESLRKMHVSDGGKVLCKSSGSSNKDDVGTNVVTLSNRYPFNTKYENDADTGYAVTGEYKGPYKARVGLLTKADTICESKPTTRQLEPSKCQHHEILRAERPNPTSSYQKTFANEVQTVPSKTVKHIASHYTASTKVKTIEAQPPRVQHTVAVPKSADAVKDERSLSIKDICTSAFGSNNSRSIPVEISHRKKSRQSYITEEQVERNMKLLLFRQRYKELLPVTWTTYSCKSSD